VAEPGLRRRPGEPVCESTPGFKAGNTPLHPYKGAAPALINPSEPKEGGKAPLFNLQFFARDLEIPAPAIFYFLRLILL